ncbi:unnamed protein product [Periconia digitata]|uniref:Uncharacterized protein n=1 Tax=Periconia digitata TaxID=1303443 RepID=A0A9W4UY24_9PLEO|nr:unnamed protein product [Periconia digitata]
MFPCSYCLVDSADLLCVFLFSRGAGLLSKLANFYPDYFSALAFLSVPYSPGLSDVDGINARTEAAFGYPTFGYQKFFNEDDAAEIIERNIESFTSAVFPGDPEVWRTDLCPYGKAKAWIEAGKMDSKLPSYETPETREARVAKFKSGGLAAPLNWYKVSMRNIDAEAINAIPKQNLVLNVPTVFMGGDKDYATRVEMMQMAAAKLKEAGLLKPDVEVKIVKGASHWITLERPDEVFTVLQELVKKVE